MLDASPSQGRFDDVAFDDSRSEYADAASVMSPTTSADTAQRMMQVRRSGGRRFAKMWAVALKRAAARCRSAVPERVSARTH
jgi:hypothetical protein